MSLKTPLLALSLALLSTTALAQEVRVIRMDDTEEAAATSPEAKTEAAAAAVTPVEPIAEVKDKPMPAAAAKPLPATPQNAGIASKSIDSESPTSDIPEPPKPKSAIAQTSETAMNTEDSMAKNQVNAFRQALESTYKQNPRIQTQRKALEESDERVSQAIGAFRPTITTGYAKGRQRTRFDSSEWEYSDSETKNIQLSQPIFQGGRNIYTYARAKDQVLANRQTLSAFTQGVLLEAIDAYMAVVEAAAVLELSRNNQQVLQRQLDASRNRFEVGDVTRTDVAQSEARFARARSDVIDSEGNLETAMATFERVIGYRPELPLPLPQNMPALPKSLEEAVDAGIKNSPRLKAAEYTVDVAENDVGVAAASLLPQVSINGIMQRDDGAGVLGSSQFDTDEITLNVSLPIYQNGSEYSQVRASKLVARRRVFEQENTRQELVEAVVDAWETLEAAVATINSQQEQVRAAEVALEGVRQEQQYGARTVLDVLDAEQELFVSRVQLVQARRQRYVSAFNLLQVTGYLTPANLNLDVERYDPQEHYDDVKWQLIGF